RAGARARDAELRLPRAAPRARVGDSVRARLDAAPVRLLGRRPLRPLPAPPHPGRAGVPGLSEQARLLALGRPDVPVPAPRRRLADGSIAPDRPRDGPGGELARAGAHPAAAARSPGLAGVARAARAAPPV